MSFERFKSLKAGWDNSSVWGSGTDYAAPTPEVITKAEEVVNAFSSFKVSVYPVVVEMLTGASVYINGEGYGAVIHIPPAGPVDWLGRPFNVKVSVDIKRFPHLATAVEWGTVAEAIVYVRGEFERAERIRAERKQQVEYLIETE